MGIFDNKTNTFVSLLTSFAFKHPRALLIYSILEITNKLGSYSTNQKREEKKTRKSLFGDFFLLF